MPTQVLFNRSRDGNGEGDDIKKSKRIKRRFRALVCCA
jgi:hypothetical protein